MKKLILLLALSTMSNAFLPVYGQLTNEDYQKALWMTTRMYGGQRSGYGPNWLIMEHNVTNNGKIRNGVDFINDADGAYDLTGGWHDCGDHVKFGQTQFYSAYILLVGYEAFTQGYGDHYSFDYKGYLAHGDFNWEGGKGYKNQIPDILDEVKYATDYFIKCTKDNNTFYSQVGNGDEDHVKWVTSTFMSTLSKNQGGENRPVLKNPNDAAMPSFCGAALAAMSRHYRKYDEVYADLCLVHAKHAYQYAKSKKSNSGGTLSGRYYGPDNDWKDNYVNLCAELYWATEDVAYKDEAISYANDIGDQYWVLDFENGQDLAHYNLMKLGHSGATSKFSQIVSSYKSKANSADLIVAGGNWGRLRYCANAAFVVALHQAYNDESNIHSSVIGTANYILGDNSSNQSFVVGFGIKSPKHPHHRNVYLNDNDVSNKNALKIPARNAQHGFLVGGTSNPSNFDDDVTTYSTSEGCIDYQAGLVGLLAYINLKKSPYDTAVFNGLAPSSFIQTQLAPNPAQDIFKIFFNQKIEVYKIKIYGVDGLAYDFKLESKSEDSLILNISNLAVQTYIIQIETSKGVFAERIIKN